MDKITVELDGGPFDGQTEKIEAPRGIGRFGFRFTVSGVYIPRIYPTWEPPEYTVVERPQLVRSDYAISGYCQRRGTYSAHYVPTDLELALVERQRRDPDAPAFIAL